MLNNYFYCWGHRHIHDFASLERLLAEAGFEQITQASFNKSKHPTLDGIDCHDPEGLEATILSRRRGEACVSSAPRRRSRRTAAGVRSRDRRNRAPPQRAQRSAPRASRRGSASPPRPHTAASAAARPGSPECGAKRPRAPSRTLASNPWTSILSQTREPASIRSSQIESGRAIGTLSVPTSADCGALRRCCAPIGNRELDHEFPATLISAVPSRSPSARRWTCQ